MNSADYPLPDPLVTAREKMLNGAACFAGRRVMVVTLFDYLKGGHSLDEFLDDFPAVSREHAQAVIDEAHAAVTKTLQSAA